MPILQDVLGVGQLWTVGFYVPDVLLEEFYKYVTRRKGNTENNPAIKDHNCKPFTDPIEKANSLNCYYASLFSCERNNPQIQSTESDKPFTISINIIRKL